MSSSNHNSTLLSDTQPANQPHFLNNVPRKRRSASHHTKPKPTSSNEGGSKEIIPTITKILIGTCFAAILTPQVTTHSTSTKLVFLLEWVAILSMMVGMYMQVARPKLSNWLQRFGHLNCLVGLMLIQGSLLQLPVTYAWIPPLGAALILGSAMFFQE